MFSTNEYFDGNVISIAYESDTNPSSVGVMAPGKYVFSTAAKEKMTVITGALEIQMPDETSSTIYNAGESFDVVADSSFNVTVETETAYLCIYG
ncbi:MAG: pyrimidine/purine nucleoside phosphorylase [Cocleimonas sp.]